MAIKFYAVKKGRVPGIYETWLECKINTDKFSGAEYHSFLTKVEADEYMNAFNVINLVDKINFKTKENLIAKSIKHEELSSIGYAFVDGSFNIKTNTYGYGGFITFNGKKEIVQGSGNEEQMAIMRNVAGEILGSINAIKRAIELNLKEINISYDYLGIEMWANDKWRRNKKETKDYYEYIQLARKEIKINFIKVLAHSGIDGNEEADTLAKQAVGII